MALRLQSDTAIDEMFRYLSTQIEGQAVWQSDCAPNQGNQGIKNQQQLAELTSFAFDLVSDQWNQRSHYNCWQDPIEEHMWHVCLKYRILQEEVEDTSRKTKFKTKFLHLVWQQTWAVHMDPLSKRL